MNFVWIYITTKDKDEAKKIATEIINARLAACANILDNMTSMYWWQGKVEEDNETVLILKSQGSLVKQITEKIKTLHSYSCPCIVALPMADGNEDFFSWIESETTQPKIT